MAYAITVFRLYRTEDSYSLMKPRSAPCFAMSTTAQWFNISNTCFLKKYLDKQCRSDQDAPE